jgi:hypothetical protein
MLIANYPSVLLSDSRGKVRLARVVELTNFTKAGSSGVLGISGSGVGVRGERCGSGGG